MILSESEKNRIRGLHREASVIKQPLNEWAAVGQYIKDTMKKTGLDGYVEGKEGFIPDNVQKKITEFIKGNPEMEETLKKGDTSTLAKWLAGKSGLLPGDQTEVKKKSTNIAKAFYKGLGGFIPESRFINEAGPFQDEVLTPEKGKAVAEKSKSEGLPKCGELLKKQAQDKQREKLDSYKDDPKGAPTGGISRVTVDVTLQALAGPLPPKASGVIAMKDGKPFCRVS